jgi:hypothetical protein
MARSFRFFTGRHSLLFRRISIAQAVPAFGGYDFDSAGNAYITTAGPVAESARLKILSLFQPHFAAVQGHFVEQSAASRIIFQEGKYNFLQLRAWRSAISARLLGLEGAVYYVALDPRDNQVLIGISQRRYEEIRSLVLQGTAHLAIPADALAFEAAPDPTETDSFSSESDCSPEAVIPEPGCGEPDPYQPPPPTTLSDYVRPVRGGLQGEFYLQQLDTTALGTIGFVARYCPGDCYYVLVTAAHNTYRMASVDYNLVAQPRFASRPRTSSDYYYVGWERWDPPWSRNRAFGISGPFAQGYTNCIEINCRRSDMALIQLEVSASGFGTLVRPQQRLDHGNTVAGQIDIYTNQFITIVGELVPVGGQVIDKIGKTTGWRVGTVVSNCTDIYIPYPDPNSSEPAVLRCQLQSGFPISGSGDSGGPMFLWYGNNQAALVGLYHRQGFGYYWGTRIHQMRNDLNLAHDDALGFGVY